MKLRSALYACVVSALVSLGCGDRPVANPADEDGNAPTYILIIQGPGLNATIDSDEACPGDGLTNPFGSRSLELPPDREYSFVFTVEDIGGVPQTRIGSNDRSLLDLEVEAPDADRVDYLTSGTDTIKTAVISRGPELYTGLLSSGKLHPTGNGATSLFVQGFDAASNSVFHTISVVIRPGAEAELFRSACR